MQVGGISRQFGFVLHSSQCNLKLPLQHNLRIHRLFHPICTEMPIIIHHRPPLAPACAVKCILPLDLRPLPQPMGEISTTYIPVSAVDHLTGLLHQL